MKVFLNGQFVPAEQAVVSAFDRGFLYGDGLFETLRVMSGVPLDWAGHWRRFAAGAEMLKLKLPFASDFLRAQASELSRQNELPDAILRLTLSRGVGQRGYSPRGADAPTFVMSLHPAPELGPQTPQWKLHTASLRVPFADALTACKSANKLLHVLARAEAEAAGADEALLLNTRNEVVEAASANVFWIEGGTLHTPPISAGALPGITRAWVLDWASSGQLPTSESRAGLDRLLRADACFLTLSSWGLIEVVAIDNQAVPTALLTSVIRERLLADWRRQVKRVE